MRITNREARCLIYLSRSGAENQEAKDIINTLYKYGVEIIICKCDVSIKKDVIKAVKQVLIARSIKEVVHVAMILEISIYLFEFLEISLIVSFSGYDIRDNIFRAVQTDAYIDNCI